MDHSPQIDQLATALAKAQAEITGAKKSSDNPFFKSKYADLAEVWDVIRKPLSENGLAVIQLPSVSDGRVNVTTILAHASGQYVSDVLSLRMVKERTNPGTGEKEFIPLDDPQAAGSAVTYARRYGLAAIVGVAQEDDDGNAATHTHVNASANGPAGAQKANSIRDECTRLANQLGLPVSARRALTEECGNDWGIVLRRLHEALDARQKSDRQDDTKL